MIPFQLQETSCVYQMVPETTPVFWSRSRNKDKLKFLTSTTSSTLPFIPPLPKAQFHNLLDNLFMLPGSQNNIFLSEKEVNWVIKNYRKICETLKGTKRTKKALWSFLILDDKWYNLNKFSRIFLLLGLSPVLMGKKESREKCKK